MIIDLLNFSRYYPGTEANVLFRLLESGIRIPSFFCITEDYNEDELNSYLQNHFQHTTHFTLRLSLAYEDNMADELVVTQEEPPLYINIQKSIMTRYADRLFEKAKKLPEIDSEGHRPIKAHVIIQEMVHATVFGELQTVCKLGIMNETVITIGEGHDSDFADRNVPFSIYRHDDTDNILFAHEPEGALKAERKLLIGLLNMSDKLKAIFKNRALTIKFIADYDAHILYLLSVHKMEQIGTEESEVVLDTTGVSRYYPGVTLPLPASLAMDLSKRIMHCTFRRFTGEKSPVTDIEELLKYVNGRLYYDTKRLNKLLSMFAEGNDMKDYVTNSQRILWKKILSPRGMAQWCEKRKIVQRFQKMVDENIRQKDAICQRIRRTLDELDKTAKIEKVAAQDINSALRKAIAALTDCLTVNTLNTFYIKMERRHLENAKLSEKKRAVIAKRITVASSFRTELRSLHGSIMGMLIEFGRRTGEAFVALGTFDNAEDVFMLSYDEALSIKKDEITNVRALIEERRKEIEAFRRMPGFTKLVFADKIVNAENIVVDFVDAVKDTFHLRGSGVMPGKAELIAVNAPDGLPRKCDPGYIYVVKKLPGSLPADSLGGLIIEEPAVFACLLPHVAKCKFPIISGAEHACTLIKSGDTVSMNSAGGDIDVCSADNP